MPVLEATSGATPSPNGLDPAPVAGTERRRRVELSGLPTTKAGALLLVDMTGAFRYERRCPRVTYDSGGRCARRNLSSRGLRL